MAMGKWISGVIGWALAGPIGGLIGFLIGSALEGKSSSYYGDTDGGQAAYSENRSRTYSAGEQRNSFLVSLLVLSSAIMKADGKVMKSELDFVKRFIAQNFGEDAVPQALKIIKELLAKDINLPEVCAQVKLYMNSSQRLQLLHYLVGICQADGNVCKAEIEMVRNIGRYLGIPDAEVNSILAMFEQNSIDKAYEVLELTPSATDEEVKRAYKRLAVKHHPDKVEALGPDVKKAAEEKFKQIAAAYEAIKKERNIH